MEFENIVKYIWMVFGSDKLSTTEVEIRLKELFDYHCPDDFAKTMSKLKQIGAVKGEVSFQNGGWVWWVDDECKTKDFTGIVV